MDPDAAIGRNLPGLAMALQPALETFAEVEARLAVARQENLS
jgi:hypothetical protein